MLEINNNPIPTPSSFKVGIQDLSNAERNSRGEMLIDRIATKRKLELTWKYLSPAELSTLLGYFKSTFFFVKYPDPEAGGSVTKTFYVGDRNIGMQSYINNKPVWNDISFNLIER